MFGDSIVICVFWGRRNERGSLRGIIYKKLYQIVYLKGGNFK